MLVVQYCEYVKKKLLNFILSFMLYELYLNKTNYNKQIRELGNLYTSSIQESGLM